MLQKYINILSYLFSHKKRQPQGSTFHPLFPTQWNPRSPKSSSSVYPPMSSIQSAVAAGWLCTLAQLVMYLHQIFSIVRCTEVRVPRGGRECLRTSKAHCRNVRCSLLFIKYNKENLLFQYCSPDYVYSLVLPQQIPLL